MTGIMETLPRKAPLPRLLARGGALAGVIAALAFPALAQDGTGPVPENGSARSYGSGWECNLGYRVDGDDCLAIDIPSTPTRPGSPMVRAGPAAAVSNRSAGHPASRSRSPRTPFSNPPATTGNATAAIAGAGHPAKPSTCPRTRFFRGKSTGTGWTCERGFAAEAGACVAIDVPPNGYLTNASYGDAWKCDRGYIETDGRCASIVVPENAFLDPDSYGPGWSCKRGFASRNNTCTAIDTPANAHLDRSGNQWRCDRAFQLENGVCVLGR